MEKEGPYHDSCNRAPCVYHYPYHLQRCLEKIVLSMSSIPDVQTGHVVRRAGRAISIQGTKREVDDAIVAIGKGYDVRLWYSCQLLQ
jgi:hypothetical protein